MNEGKQTDVSEAIRDAATQYAFNRWRSLRLHGSTYLFALAGATLILVGIGVGHSNRHDAKTWQSVLFMASMPCYAASLWMMYKKCPRGDRWGAVREQSLGAHLDAGVAAEQPTFRDQRWWFLPLAFVVASGALFGVMWLTLPSSSRFDLEAVLTVCIVSLICAGGCVWHMRRWLGGDWRGFIRERSIRVQQDAGVVVEEPTFREPKWWFWPLAFIVTPAYVLGVLSFSMQSPQRFQPLVLAGGLTLLGLVILSARDKHARSYWRPVHFIAWGLYWCYALAVAGGLPLPFADVTRPWRSSAWAIRILVPLVLFTIIQIVVCEVYSRRQFRRLQRLVDETPPIEGADETD